MYTSLITITIKRWFDKVNWNSYFNYRISIESLEDNTTPTTIIKAKYNLEYWYGSHPFHVARQHLEELGYNLDTCKVSEFDLGYGLQRDMKNL